MRGSSESLYQVLSGTCVEWAWDERHFGANVEMRWESDRAFREVTSGKPVQPVLDLMRQVSFRVAGHPGGAWRQPPPLDELSRSEMPHIDNVSFSWCFRVVNCPFGEYYDSRMVRCGRYAFVGHRETDADVIASITYGDAIAVRAGAIEPIRALESGVLHKGEFEDLMLLSGFLQLPTTLRAWSTCAHSGTVLGEYCEALNRAADAEAPHLPS